MPRRDPLAYSFVWWEPGSVPHGDSAIHRDDGSGYIPRRLGAQEGDGRTHFVGGAEPAEGHETLQFGLALLGDGVEHDGGDGARGDEVAGDVPGGQFPGDRSG